MPHISVVSPVYRAEGCVKELCDRLRSSLSSITNDFEIVLVEDRGPDNSWQVIEQEASKDPRIRGIRLARNFGQHRAITAGLDVASGDWVVVMDCDLQDPPEDIVKLYAKAIEGYSIVVAQFEERAESSFRQLISKVFWGVLSWFAGIRFDHRVGNFRIMSREVVESFRLYREQLRFLGGITSLMGFTTTSISLKRDPRFAGETSYSLRRLLAVATDIVMAYSDKPLKISVIFGLFIAGLSFCFGALILILRLAGIINVPGWAGVMVSLYLVGGLIIANLGVIGYYIGKIFDEAKRRPIYVVESKTASLRSSPSYLSHRTSGNGPVIWITGLSGAGKTTLMVEVVSRFRRNNVAVVALDGDGLREVFGVTSIDGRDHDRQKRLNLALQYSRLCKTISSQGTVVVISTISLFREVHSWNRANLPGYFEVYLKVPLDELRRRDPKGIYSRFDKGELSDVAGLDIPIDEPESPDLLIEFDSTKTSSDLADRVLDKVRSRLIQQNA
jgi:adenylylsulfate kinase-like enzyme/glycosyltransferase involved in cell wall biosynthesis